MSKKFILIHFRGAWLDKAYKEPGDLYAYGPFDSLEIAQAWQTLAVEDSVLDQENALPDRSMILSIEDGGIFEQDLWSDEDNAFGPKQIHAEPDLDRWDDWCTDQWGDDEWSEPSDEQATALDLVLPTWRAELAEARAEVGR